MLHLPFAFSSSKPVTFDFNARVEKSTPAKSSLQMIYDDLGLAMMGLSQNAFESAIKGYEYLKMNGILANQNVLSIVDFTLPSTEKRLFIIDVKSEKVLFNTYVSHGQNTGDKYAKRFSNRPESYQSSLGFYLTSGTYNGKNGFSMRLDGLERNINDMAEERAIVMHGAPYVSENFIKSRGFLGRS